MARVQRVLAAHDAEITALGQFARSGSNRREPAAGCRASPAARHGLETPTFGT
jgi:hypothetical protein